MKRHYFALYDSGDLRHLGVFESMSDAYAAAEDDVIHVYTDAGLRDLQHQIDWELERAIKYQCRVSVALYTPESIEAGEPPITETLHQDEYDCDELRGLAIRYGIFHFENPWWESAPDENFQDGSHKIYRLHLQAVDGRLPSLADYRRVTEILNR
ncbi:MAG: hypothetical protein RBU21_02850 [FCB group bacterium]|jgi:hypothetical protein|nr:hypothetical protein [FCB group bacterium]